MVVRCRAFSVTVFRSEIVFGPVELSVGSVVALVPLPLVIVVGIGRTSLLRLEC